MKALACLAACLALASLAAPAVAAVRLAPPHRSTAPVVISGGRHVGPGGSQLVWFGGGFGPGSYAPPVVGGDDQTPSFAGAQATAYASTSPAPRGATAAPAAAPRPGPHIIYIGQQPEIHGPKVIYGRP